MRHERLLVQPLPRLLRLSEPPPQEFEVNNDPDRPAQVGELTHDTRDHLFLALASDAEPGEGDTGSVDEVGEDVTDDPVAGVLVQDREGDFGTGEGEGVGLAGGEEEGELGGEEKS